MTVALALPASVPVSVGTVRLDGAIYRFRCEWNTTTERWYLSLSSTAHTIRGIPMTVGHDLLAPYGYGDLLGELWVVDGSGRGEDPTLSGLGERWTVEYTPRGEL